MSEKDVIINDNLTNENFLFLCAKNYRNPQCASTEEFLQDIKKLKYIKKLLTKYTTSQEIDVRLVLNHVIVLNNVFGPVFLCRLIFLKMQNQLIYIKPFLVYLNLMQKYIVNINGKIYDSDDIGMDQGIIDKLRKLEENSRV